jgi:hypothetical protein
MEKTLSRVVSRLAVDKVIQDQIAWWENELNSINREMSEMAQRYKDNSCTLDGLILYKQSHEARVADIRTRLMELNDISNAIDRLG